MRSEPGLLSAQRMLALKAQQHTLGYHLGFYPTLPGAPYKSVFRDLNFASSTAGPETERLAQRRFVALSVPGRRHQQLSHCVSCYLSPMATIGEKSGISGDMILPRQ